MGTPLTVAGDTREVLRRAGLDDRPIVRLAGVEDRAGAQALHGESLRVAQVDLPRLQTGEWWAHDLAGCSVRDGEREVGTVAELLELPSCEVLDVRRPDGAQLLVPMVKDAIRRVDVVGRTIDVDLAFLGEQ